MAKIEQVAEMGFVRVCGMLHDLFEKTEKVPNMICRRLSEAEHQHAREKLKEWGFREYDGGVYRKFWRTVDISVHEGKVVEKDVCTKEIYLHMGCCMRQKDLQKNMTIPECHFVKGMMCLSWGLYTHPSLRSAEDRYGETIHHQRIEHIR